MPARVTLPLLMAAVLAACVTSRTGHLYPVGGPLATQTPLPIYTLKAGGIIPPGPMSATLPSGEVCKGTWSFVPQADPSSNRMQGDWDRVYGSGYFVANVLGSKLFAHAVLTGDRGTVLTVEIYKVDKPSSPLIGIAEDNNGNVFKLAF